MMDEIRACDNQFCGYAALVCVYWIPSVFMMVIFNSYF